MPSSPKIKREDMLQATLDIVIENGYPNITLLEPIAEFFLRIGCRAYFRQFGK